MKDTLIIIYSVKQAEGDITLEDNSLQIKK